MNQEDKEKETRSEREISGKLVESRERLRNTWLGRILYDKELKQEKVTWLIIFESVIRTIILFFQKLEHSVKTQFFFVLFLLVYLVNSIITVYPLTIEAPGEYSSTDIFIASDEYQDEDVNMLSVYSLKGTSLLDYLVILGMNLRHLSYIKIGTLQEKDPELTRELSYMSDLLDMQMSAYLSVYDYIGEPKPFDVELKVGKVLFKEDEKPVLLPDDEIIAINGKKVNTLLDIELSKSSDTVDIQIKRGSSYLTLNTSLKNILIGRTITLSNPKDYEEFMDFANLGIKGYEGRSAGAALALSFYNSHFEDVVKGRKIALTGTIDEYGNIGQIAGIEQKTILAIENDTDIMFVPKDIDIAPNYTDAKNVVKRTKSKMKVIEVKTLADIIDYLKK